MNQNLGSLLLWGVLYLGIGCGDGGDTTDTSDRMDTADTATETGTVDTADTATETDTDTDDTDTVGDTGTLVFSFTQARTTVPLGTARLVFDFYNDDSELVFSEERAFATLITFEDVPISVVRVEVTGLSSDGFVLVTASSDVQVVPGGSQQVDVAAAFVTLDALQVTPDPVVLDVAATTTLTVSGQFSDGALLELSADNADFVSNNEAVATVDAQGTVTGAGAGSTTIVVSYTIPGTSAEVVSDPIPVTVMAVITLDRLLVSPSPVVVKAGGTVSLTIQAEYSDDSTQTLSASEVTYAGIDGTVATVANGVVTGEAQGNTTFTASYTEPVSQTEVTSDPITVTVTAPTLDAITVTPDPVSVLLGGTAQLALEGHFSDGSTAGLDATLATYTGHDTGVVGIEDGLITAVDAGSTSVTVGFVDAVTTNTIHSNPVAIAVAGPAVVLSGANTFDTVSGELNGVVPVGWDGTTLLVAGFELQTGATLAVSGSAPLLVDAPGDVTIAGTLSAAGQPGGDASGSAPGAAGAAGPGGSAGGLAGGTASANRQGASGGGAGGGGGGQTLGVVYSDGLFIGENENGGGGAGHSVAGQAGASGGSTGSVGAAGSAYTSIPSTLLGGSGGGGGSAYVSATGQVYGGGGGGGGGGLVSLVSGGLLTVSGTIDVSGGDGGDRDSSNNAGGGGGGGSGGSILLLAPNQPTVSGTLAISGGGGGDGAADGGNGAAGRSVVGTL